MKFFLLSAHTRPSGGTKVLNQLVNMINNKGFETYYVTPNKESRPVEFMAKPCPVIGVSAFLGKCHPEDIVINCWQEKELHQAAKSCNSRNKIFWQHGASIPLYRTFNSHDVYRDGTYSQFWNVSSSCAKYIEKKYNINNISIVHPFFDDETLTDFLPLAIKSERNGILCLRRRGQESLPDIIKLFPKQKITVLQSPFTDIQLYSALVNHKFFITYDNGMKGDFLIKKRIKKYFANCNRLRHNIFSWLLNKDRWLVPKNNLLGFPVTACEAAWLGTIVIGFAMGGGLEWMSTDNMYLAKDGNLESLLNKIQEATEDSEFNLLQKRQLAHEAVSIFNKEHTWQQISKLLNIK